MQTQVAKEARKISVEAIFVKIADLLQILATARATKVGGMKLNFGATVLVFDMLSFHGEKFSKSIVCTQSHRKMFMRN